jgi:exosortase
MNPPATRCTPFRALPWLAKAVALALCAAVAALALFLWPLWRNDDNLGHGIFLPFLAAILIVESRRDPSPRFLQPGAWPLVGCTLLILAAMASLAMAVAFAAALGWTYEMAEFMLASSLTFTFGAAWLGFADRCLRFIPLNWQAAVAAVLWFFAAPPPPGTYNRLAFFLQSEVTHGVVRVLTAIGVAAYQDGNVIELAHTSVGVSEACSGVRSLISCTVAGLFLSGVLVRRPAHRALVILLSPALGLAMNFIRSLLLTLLANAGVDIGGRWHDLTGASIIVGTTVLVALLALRLRRRESPAPQAVPAEQPVPVSGSPLSGIVAAGMLLAAVVGCVLASATQYSRINPGTVPDLAALLPEAPPGWTVHSTPDLEQYSGTLHTHALVERVYSEGPTLESTRFTLYLAYWRPGQAPVSLVDAHTPDACWPGTGWDSKPVPKEREALEIGGRTLAPAECRLFEHDVFETRVWYWHLYGGKPLAFVDPYSATTLLKLAWRYGFGETKDQLFVRVSSNRPWEEIASQPALRQFFAGLKPLGL